MKKISEVYTINSRRKKGVYKCFCGNIFATYDSHIKTGKTKSCGCITTQLKIKGLTKHNKSNTKIYRVWASMKNRCLNKNDKRFNDYGGRGIKLYNKWIYDFESFYQYVSNLQGFNEMDANGNRMSLDRKNNNGNYEPKNIKWSSAIDQSLNSRLRMDNKSGHKGISFHKQSNKWMVFINHNRKRKYIGLFESITDAIHARKSEELELELLKYD